MLNTCFLRNISIWTISIGFANRRSNQSMQFHQFDVRLNIYLIKWRSISFLFAANSQSNERLTTTETRSMSQSEVNSSSIVTNSTTTTTKKETFKSERITTPKEEDDDWYDSMHLLLEQDLRPVSPFASEQSEEIYEELKMLANEFLKVKQQHKFDHCKTMHDLLTAI